MHDPKTYPNPDVFEPERFLKNGTLNHDVLAPESVVFGYGRRYETYTLRSGRAIILTRWYAGSV